MDKVEVRVMFAALPARDFDNNKVASTMYVSTYGGKQVFCVTTHTVDYDT